MKPIVIIMAMQEEAKHFIQQFNFVPVPEADSSLNFPLHVYQAQFKQHELILILPPQHPVHQVDSIGTQMAAIATWEAIRRFDPQLIINTGSAGGFAAQGAQVGDIYLIQEHPIYYHDRHIPVGNFAAYGRGGYRPHSIKVVEGNISFKNGVLSSGNSFVTTENPILKEFQVSLVDMEAAAVAEVAERLHVPFLVVKVISDLVDKSATSEEFEHNIQHVCEELPAAIMEILESL
jgi:5'-methylthioadenosine/S-adenosylhomocysteine nucleosidase